VSLTIRWPIRPTLLDVDRACILGAYRSALSVLLGAPAGDARLVKRGEDKGGDYVGYSAHPEQWEAPVGEAALGWELDPIMASMGVSGEHISVRASGLPEGRVFSGRALSSARRPGYATLEWGGDSPPGAVEAAFRDAFGPYGRPTPAVRVQVALERVRIDVAWGLLSEAQLRVELEELHLLAGEGAPEARPALLEARGALAGARSPRDHYPAAIRRIDEALS